MKLNAKQLRVYQSSGDSSSHQKNDIYLCLDNILDTYNIGSIFRLADAVGAKKIYLCKGSVTPPNHRIKKASINTTEVVEWVYKETTLEALSELRDLVPGIQIVAVEQAENSTPYDKFEYKLPICLVVGHETDGVSKEVLDLCDGIVELPMFGVNISLNVMVSLAIVLYHAISNMTDRN